MLFLFSVGLGLTTLRQLLESTQGSETELDSEQWMKMDHKVLFKSDKQALTLTVPTLNEHAIVSTIACLTPAQTLSSLPCQNPLQGESSVL